MNRLAAALCLAAPLLAPAALSAQSDGIPIVAGYQHTVVSQALGEDRTVQVYLPLDYHLTEKDYPVLYVLDGPGHFLHTAASVQFLSNNNRMPQMLVVAVANSSGNRTRDLTPARAGQKTANANGGGADTFLEFLRDELKPWVDAKYRTTSFEMLIGHSFGGLFVSHVINTDPATFDAYIAISPSLWWDSGKFLKNLESLFDRYPDASSSLYMTLGNEGGNMITAAESFVKTLSEKAPDSFRWNWAPMPTEDHGSVPARSTYDGLEWIFERWGAGSLFEDLATEGVSSLKPVLDHFDMVAEMFGLDGKPPEEQLNAAAYRLLQDGKANDALEIFELVVELYPESANAHDSFGDGLRSVCRLDEAREQYGQAILKAVSAGDGPRATAYRESARELLALENRGGCRD